MKQTYNDYELGKAEREHIFETEILPAIFSDTEPSKEPTVVFLGGQPGAGKGKVAARTKSELETDVVIDPDEFRKFHPDFGEINENHGSEAARYTHEDASAWADMARDYAMENGYNLVIDGTMKTPKSAQKRMQKFKDNGYKVNVKVLAVNEFTSQSGVIGRFISQAKRLGSGRSVPQEIQKAAYEGLFETVKMLQESDIADRVEVHSRKEKVYDSENEPLENLSDAFEKERENVYFEEEISEVIAKLREHKEYVEKNDLDSNDSISKNIDKLLAYCSYYRTRKKRQKRQKEVTPQRRSASQSM